MVHYTVHNIAFSEWALKSYVCQQIYAQVGTYEISTPQEIDPDSPCCEDLEFIAAHHKWVRFECKSASTYLKDYPQNLTDAKHILFWGKVALAEEAPADRAIRTQTIDQGNRTQF